MIYPKVAIIGRPNVGKSTLFNRMVKGRNAIVGAEAGITRDRHDAFVFWKTKKFQIMDTGGIEPTASLDLDLLMQKQVELALNEAELVLFLLDGKFGVHPTDKIIAQSLRRKKKKVLWVINKVDVPRLEPDLYEFYELGTDAFYYISAEHALGIEQLLDDIVEGLPESKEEEKIEEEVKIALVGRPNVGKSTLVNKLLGQERCLVSPEALTTRDAIDTYLVRDHVLFTLIDTAGIRKRNKVNTDLEFYATTRSEKAIKRADVAFLLIDAEDGIVEQDLKIANSAIEAGTSLMILVNKWDLIHKDTKTAQEFEKDFRYKYPQFHWVPLIFLSALTGQRVHKLLDMSLGILEERRKRLTGDVLKLFLERKLEELSPPFYRGKKPRISKLSQMDVSPPLFYFKTNPINSIKDSYKQYLQNALRDEFGFRATPLKCVFRKTIHHRPYHS